MQLATLLLFLLLCGVYFFSFGTAIHLIDQKLQLKTGSMLGSVGISIAQWDLEFDDDLYYFVGPPCAPGLTQETLTSSAVAADPCWAGCNFAPDDPADCGQPFNTTDPRCQQFCDSHPKKPILCNFAERPWHVLKPDVESPLINVTIGPTLYLRINWLKIEQGFRFEALTTVGRVSATAVALMDYSALLDSDSWCLAALSPSPYANACPSAQCFRYGTWEVAAFVFADTTLDDYTATSSFIFRSFAVEQPNVRRTEPLPDAPVTFPAQASELHVPLQFGVTANAIFDPYVDFAFFQLTTTYCGLINIQHEKAEWDRVSCRVLMGASTENPFPVDINSDIIFIEQSMKPMWICPTPPQEVVVVFFALLRFTRTNDPPLSNPEMHYFTVDYYRPEDDWRKYRLGELSTESNYSRFTNFPPLDTWSTGLAANLFSVSCPDPANPVNSVDFTCSSGSSLLGTCFQLAFGLPVDPWTISLLPVPELIRQANPEGFGNIDFPIDQVTASKRLSAFLILETSLDGSVLTQSLGPDWMDLWSQCVLHIGSNTPIVAGDGNWFIADLTLEPIVPECVYSEFKLLSEQITSSIESMGQHPFEAYSDRVQIDELTFHDPWQACNTLAQSTLARLYTTNVTLYSSVACVDTTAETDPCCNYDLSWTECCAPRDVSTTVGAYAVNVNATEELCDFPSCLEPLLEEYYRAVLNNQVGGCAGPDLSAKLRAPIRAYRDCREAAFGNDFELPSCVMDSECTSMAAGTSVSCNQVTKQCSYNFSDSLTYFFGCLAENLPIEASIKLIELNGWKINHQSELAPLLQSQYGQSTECVDEALGSVWSTFNEYLLSGNLIGGCPNCRLHAADPSYQTPPWCDVRTPSSCTYFWGIYSKGLNCENKV